MGSEGMGAGGRPKRAGGTASWRASWRIVPVVLLAGAWMCAASTDAIAQAAAPGVAAAGTAGRQMGTVKLVTGASLSLATDAGQALTVSVTAGAKVLQLAPGSTDLKAARTIELKDISIGDRVLVTGKPGEGAASFAASRVILMKSGDIAERQAAQQADWQRRGMGGLVSAVDAGTGVLTVAAGAKKLEVRTSAATLYRRYAGGSVKFEDAKPGTLGEIRAGDQLRVRGAKSEDGGSVAAEEIVTGSFRTLSGTIASLDKAAGNLMLNDVATKKKVTVKMTASSEVRTLPAEAAARFAERARGGTGGKVAPGGALAGAEAKRAEAGMDLSQIVSRLPAGAWADLKVGDAVMIVVTPGEAPGDAQGEAATAVTVLSGVGPILAATPSGAPQMSFSPWNVSGDSGGG